MLEQNLQINRLNHTDLNMYQCGTQNCSASHFYGPAVRDHFLIHFIHSGKGRFLVGEKTYHLQTGQGFLICPDIVTFYQADEEDPWSYSWVGFHGLKAESYLKAAGLSMENPIFSGDREGFIADCFHQMIAAKNLQKGREIRLMGEFYRFLSQLIEQNGRDRFLDDTGSRKEFYVKQAIEYIEMNYSHKMTIGNLAGQLNLDRSYLGSIFRRQLDISLQDFLVSFRINKACELMKNDALSIGDVSRSVGYDDPLQFSKLFHKTKGMSPREYRKAYREGIL